MTNFPAFDFDKPPQVGDVVTMPGGQRYELTGTEPHTSRAGDPSILLAWKSHCPKCGDVFVVRTGLRTKWPNRRCRNCVRPGSAVR